MILLDAGPMALIRGQAGGRTGVRGGDVIALRPLSLDLSARIGPAPWIAPGIEEEQDPVRGGGGGGGGARRHAGSVSQALPQTLLPVQERVSRLADGAQPAVLKVVSYASLGPSGGARSLVRYITREGELPGVTEDGRQVDEPGTADDVLSEWSALAPPPKRTFITLELTGRLAADANGLVASAAAVCQAVAPDRDLAFAVRREGKAALDEEGEGTVRILLVAALANRQGRHLALGMQGREALGQAARDAGLDAATVGYRRTARSEGEIASRLEMLARLSPDSNVFTDNAVVLASEAGRRRLAVRWISIAEPSAKRRDVMHLALSSRAGTDPQAFAHGVEVFLDRTFPGHPRVVAIHGPEDVETKRTNHVHAHVALVMHGPEGKLRTSPAILHSWRHALAEALCEQGIATVATRRHDLAHAPAYAAKHAQRAEREVPSASDVRRVAAKRQRHACEPTRDAGWARAREAAIAWNGIARQPAEGQRAQTIYAELTVARFIAARARGERVEDAIMSVEKEIGVDVEQGRGVHPAAAALTASFARIEASLAEPRDREALQAMLVRVLDVAREARAEDQVSDNRGSVARVADHATSDEADDQSGGSAYGPDAMRRGEALLDAVTAVERPGQRTFAAYQEKLDALALAPWDEGRRAEAREALVEVTLADARLNRAASAVALEAVRGNAYLDGLIDAHADDQNHDQTLVRMRAFVREAGLDALPPAEADAALLAALKEDGPSPVAAAESQRIDRLVERERAIEALQAEADPTTRFVYDPVGNGERPTLAPDRSKDPDTQALLTDVQRSRDAIDRLDGNVDRAFEAVQFVQDDGARDQLKELALDLERHEELYRDRLALVALAAAQGDNELDRAIDDTDAKGLRALRDHIRTHRLHEQSDPEAAVLATVRDDACTPQQDARWERYEVLTYDEFRRTDQTLWKEHVRQDSPDGTRTDHRNIREIAEEREEGQGTPADAREARDHEGENREAYDAYLRAHGEAQDRRTISQEGTDNRSPSRDAADLSGADRGAGTRRQRPVDEQEM